MMKKREKQNNSALAQIDPGRKYITQPVSSSRESKFSAQKNSLGQTGII